MTQAPPPGRAVPRHRRKNKRAVLVWIWIVALSVAALLATYMLFVEPPPPHKIVIASGSPTGAYYRYAKRYAELLSKEHLTVEVRETAGSVENLRLLSDPGSGVSVAIVQSGLASPDELARFHALGSLYREPLWIFYRGQERLERISQLSGKKIGIGSAGSGTSAIARQLLAANGLMESRASNGSARATLIEQSVEAAAGALRDGSLDAAFFVAAFEADYIQNLLNDPEVKLLGFDQHEAYRRRFRFLAPVTLPAGIVNLSQNIPAQDVDLLAPTAMLVVRNDFHPALVPVLLMAAARVHGAGSELSDPGEFPSARFCDFPVSDEARRYYTSGQPFLQRLLPFWLASVADRAKVMLIPLVMLLMPLFRAAPPLMRWRTRRKIYRWYSDLREIDENLVSGLPGPELDLELARLHKIERQVSRVEVPLSYMEEFYHLRLHLRMLEQHLVELKSQREIGVPDPPVEE